MRNQKEWRWNIIKIKFRENLICFENIGYLCITFIFCIIITLLVLTLTNNMEGLNYKKIRNVNEASKLLTDRKLSSSYIVILDSGIDRNYYNKNYGKLIYGARHVSRWGPFFGDAFVDYSCENTHGTNVQWICDQVFFSSVASDSKNKNLVQTIQYKICDNKGDSTIQGLIFAINDIVNYYVVEKKINIAVINFSSGITYTNPNSKVAIALKKELQQTIDNAIKHGISIVTCSGNENKKIFEYPALNNNVIVVGATDKNNKRSIFVDLHFILS